MDKLRNDGGFSLTELLTVVVIIGALAAIAIPTFVALRERGFQAAVESDLRNAALAMFTVAATENRFPVAGVLTFPVSRGVTVSIALPAAADDGSEFCLEGRHAQLGAGIVATYDTRAGGLTAANSC